MCPAEFFGVHLLSPDVPTAPKEQRLRLQPVLGESAQSGSEHAGFAGQQLAEVIRNSRPFNSDVIVSIKSGF
jgi:hypothetical protein